MECPIPPLILRLSKYERPNPVWGWIHAIGASSTRSGSGMTEGEGHVSGGWIGWIIVDVMLGKW